MDATDYPPNTGDNPPGAGDHRADSGPARGSQLFACADGYMMGFVEFGPGVDPRSYTKCQLMEAAVGQDIRMAPVNTTRDIVEDRHLASRGYWRQVGDHVHPGPAVRLSRTPLTMARPAPQLGEDQELLHRAPRAALPATNAATRLGEAFAGLRVADFSWVGVGPITAKALADHGATVVRVESETRLDVLRRLPPFKDGLPGLNRSQWFANVNSSKLGLSLNLATGEGRAVTRKLVDWAAVIVESFTPGTMARLGLDYETISATRPELIMLSTCLMGQTGVYASYGGFGGHGAAIAGLHAKAEESLAGAESEFANGRFNNCANRSYYSCFQAAVAGLLREGVRPADPRQQWGARLRAVPVRRSTHQPAKAIPRRTP